MSFYQECGADYTQLCRASRGVQFSVQLELGGEAMANQRGVSLEALIRFLSVVQSRSLSHQVT
jgi:hypothetical protein